MNENGPLSEVITAYLQALDAGQAPDRAEVLANHPGLAAELRRFFATQDRLTELAGPLRPELPAAPRRFGDYEVLGEIGRGGMGVVYRARQVSLGRVVALKMLAGGCAEGHGERLRQESRLLAELEHPHIVPVYDVGQHEGRAFFAMKEIVGSDLEEALPALRKDIPEGVRLLAVVARAVHFAHQKGVLHRDLKPANVLLGQDGTPYVTDFGLARRLEDAPALTATGALVGTPAYMAPEQATGDKALTAAVDVWALGVMLYRLLTGELPYRGGTPLETLHLIVAGRLRPPGKLAPGVDRALEAICLRCLRSDPRDRYQTAAEVAEDLERWLKGARVSARDLKQRAWSRARRLTRVARRSWWLLLLLAVSVLAGYVVWAPYQEARHRAMMDRVEFALERGQVERARELFQARQEWPVGRQEDPVRERRERMRRMFEGHLFGIQPVLWNKVWWRPNGNLVEHRQERDGWTGVALRALSREEPDKGLPEDLSSSPDGKLVLWRLDLAQKRWASEVENPRAAFERLLREAGQCDILLNAEGPDGVLRGTLEGVNWFGDWKVIPGVGSAIQVYLLCNKGKEANPSRAFVLPACRYGVSWSEDGQQIYFYAPHAARGSVGWSEEGQQIDLFYRARAVGRIQSFWPLQLTYDLRTPGWARIVDSRPAIWRPRGGPDRTRVSFPPDESRCDDLGELEVLAFLRSRKATEKALVKLSYDGTRVLIGTHGKERGLDPIVNVWRLPGAPSR
jgi:hypothetical protein